MFVFMILTIRILFCFEFHSFQKEIRQFFESHFDFVVLTGTLIDNFDWSNCHFRTGSHNIYFLMGFFCVI